MAHEYGPFGQHSKLWVVLCMLLAVHTLWNAAQWSGNAQIEKLHFKLQSVTSEPVKDVLPRVRPSAHDSGPLSTKRGAIIHEQVTPTASASREPTATASSTQEPVPRPLRLISTDFHISPIADLKHIVSTYMRGQDVSIKDLSLSGACNRMGTCAKADQLKVLRQGAWEEGIYASSAYKRQFFSVYTEDPFVSSFDSVICMHPTGMCEFYMPFNLSMIIWSTTRFEQGREGNPTRLAGFINNFRAIAARPGNVVLANNLYDVHYVHYFTGILPRYVPSLCTYPGVTYGWTSGHVSAKMDILVHGFRPKRVFVEGELGKFLEPLHAASRSAFLPYKFVGYRQALGDNYAYSDLVKYPAILYLPYQVSVMSFYEHYRMGIPIIAPSLELLTTWHLDYLLVAERTWDTAMANQPKHGSVLPRHPDADEKFDPNDEFSRDAVKYWLQWSDFYHFPNVILFDTFEELPGILARTDLQEVSRKMRKFSVEQEHEVVETWNDILAHLPRRTDRPPLKGTYEQQMDAVYGQGSWTEY